MPELPEIEVLRRSLEPHLVGDRIERVEVRNLALREPVDVRSLARRTGGREVAAARRRGPVKPFLMDATVVVGLGNIYATEALFRAGVHPARSVGRISRERWDRLADAGISVLSQAIVQGGTTLNDFADGEGRSG